MINSEEIQPLIVLQKAQAAYDVIIEQLTEIAPTLKNIEQDLTGATTHNAVVHKKLEEVRKRYRNLELSLADLQQALDKYNKQIYEVKSNKEYSAMVTEIANIKGKISDIETDILLAMDELETLSKEIKLADDILKKEQNEIELRKAQVEKRQNELMEQQKALGEELEKAQANVPSGLKNEYDRIHDFTGSTVVAPTKRRGDFFVCGGCFMKITQQTLSELRKGKVFQCEACARILYWCDDGS